MFLKCNVRHKDGKEHRYWSIVESRRCEGGRIVQRPVHYLGEINDSQRKCLSVFQSVVVLRRRLDCDGIAADTGDRLPIGVGAQSWRSFQFESRLRGRRP